MSTTETRRISKRITKCMVTNSTYIFYTKSIPIHSTQGNPSPTCTRFSGTSLTRCLNTLAVINPKHPEDIYLVKNGRKRLEYTQKAHMAAVSLLGSVFVPFLSPRSVWTYLRVIE